jgi:hypothetical protein
MLVLESPNVSTWSVILSVPLQLVVIVSLFATDRDGYMKTTLRSVACVRNNEDSEVLQSNA